jgi:hypothetical protein
MVRGASDSEQIRMRELKATRRCVWREFEDNPKETHLAAKLKIIDDQIAQSNRHSDHDANKSADSETATTQEVGGLFLLLAVSQRRGS